MDATIVTGAARYGIDTKVPKMLYASIERATVARRETEKFAGRQGARDSRCSRRSVREAGSLSSARRPGRP